MGNQLAVTTQKAASSDNAAVPFDSKYQAYAYYGGPTQTMKDKVEETEKMGGTVGVWVCGLIGVCVCDRPTYQSVRLCYVCAVLIIATTHTLLPAHTYAQPACRRALKRFATCI